MLRKPEDVKIGDKTLKEILDDHRQWLWSTQSLEIASTRTDAGKQAVFKFHEMPDMSNVDFRGYCLYKVVFPHVNLRGSDLNNVILAEADLHCADLTGASLTEAQLMFSKLGDAVLDAAQCIRARFRGADMYRSSLVNTNLEGADLAGAYFAGAVLLNTNLKGARLPEDSLFCGKILSAKIDEEVAEQVLLTLMNCIQESGLSGLVKDLQTPAVTARMTKALQWRRDKTALEAKLYKICREERDEAFYRFAREV